ncbi:MAG: hypothetical protein J6O01_04420 [Bacteroidales bacterium]|nr:hypothetical protein [Bacteroidales bacterium]MBQ9451366.1 hypothetical protein [Bacteroidales bacterium]
MVKEDPLEKLERKQAEKKSNGGLKAVMIAMIVVALALAAALYYVMTTKNKLVDELNQEKEDLTEQIQALQSDYENLSSEYDTINAQLDSSREEIAQLVDRVKKTEATDRAKIRQYEKELGTLRSIMRSYINQIDSLNTLNHRLTEEAATARKEAEETRQINTQLTQRVEDLTSRVTAGSILKAHNFVMYAYNNNDKITDKANRVVRFLVNLSLNENELAERGPVRVYVRVTDPDGNLLSDGRGTTFTFGGETLEATASREVDYQGKEVDLGIYVNNVESFKKGIYTVNAYTTQAQLGHGELLLR